MSAVSGPDLYRCASPELTFPYPLYRDPAMEKLKLAHMKQNQVWASSIYLYVVLSSSN